MPALNNEIKSLLVSNGAALVGFADLKEINPEARGNFPCGISIAVALAPQIITQICEGPTAAYIEECLRADALLNSLGKLAVEFLIAHGFEANQQATTNTTGTKYPPKLTTKLPHKTVATRAGLGWIGKTPLLITKEYGSAVRLGSILTNARLDAGVPINTSQCGDCSACVTVCPAHAITGEKWHAGIKRDVLFDAYTCRKTARKSIIKRTGRETKGRTFCGMCIAACPWTLKYISSVY